MPVSFFLIEPASANVLFFPWHQENSPAVIAGWQQNRVTHILPPPKEPATQKG
jgi:hypothetical protein